MATALTKFEIRLPLDTGDRNAQDIAIQNFLSGLAALTPFTLTNVYQVDAGGAVTEWNLIFGLLTAAQTTTGLALLNTLNTALGFNVLCYTWTVTKQP